MEKQKLIEEFKFYELWGSYREYKDCTLSVEDEKDVKLAVKKAYIDMMPRTINGLGLKFLENQKNKEKRDYLVNYKNKQIDNVLNHLATKVANIMRKKEFDDDIHAALCNDFRIDYTNAIDNINQIIISEYKNATPIEVKKVTYGKAQKIVNMTFKYLTLFNNAANEKYDKIFERCHMPIDSIIIQYFKEKGVIRNMVWSNLDSRDYNVLQGDKGKIREYCENELTGQLLYDEFSIWKKMQFDKNSEDM